MWNKLKINRGTLHYRTIEKKEENKITNSNKQLKIIDYR